MGKVLKPYLVIIKNGKGYPYTFAIWALDSLDAFFSLGRGVLRNEDSLESVEELPTSHGSLLEKIYEDFGASTPRAIIQQFCRGGRQVIALS